MAATKKAAVKKVAIKKAPARKARARKPATKKRPVIRRAKSLRNAGRPSAAAMRRQRAKRQPSSLELKVYAILEDLRIPFEREKRISRVTVDIFIGPKTVVEAQGCHWHACEKCNKELSADQKKWQVKDGRRLYILRKLGYNVIQIWEHEVEKDPERVRKLLSLLAPKKVEACS